MKRIVLFTAIILTAGLFASGQVLAAGQTGQYGSEAGVTGTSQLDQEQVRELQSILQDEGYDVGEISGELNTETRSAIREFQRSEGLAVSGEPDENTLRALAPSAEQQEFFGLSPEFGEEETFEREPMEERETFESTPGEEGQIQETPRAID